jgi:integrase
MMQPKISKRGDRFLVRYDEYVTVANGDGTTTRVRKERTNSFRTEREAKERARVIETSHARGEVFVEAQHRPVARLRDVALAYAVATKNDRTVRFRQSMMNKLLGFTGDTATVDVLSADMLRAYAESLRPMKTLDRYVGEVEAMWAWAHGRELAGVPQPRRIVGDDVIRPPPVWAVATPSWGDCDAMIAHLAGWHGRVALVLRYTGLRASQVLTLDRSDIELTKGVLRLRAEARGAKGFGRHRAVPLHPALVAEMRTWALPVAGLIFVSNDIRREKPGVWREDALVGPFTRAWRESKVAEVKWGAPENDAGGRIRARPTHAFRSAFKTELLRAEVAQVVTDLLVGHTSGATQAAYVPEGDPTASPFWKLMCEALSKVPIVKAADHVSAPDERR